MTTEQKYIVALDQGTTSSRAVVLDHNANIVCTAQREFTQIYPKAGWVEHDPLEIYATQSSTLVEALAKAGIRSDQVAGIGITNQRIISKQHKYVNSSSNMHTSNKKEKEIPSVCFHSAVFLSPHSSAVQKMKT